ncbi:MAG: Holliday junction resolvase RuvX [Patescibacteria group bacterium]
MKYLGIDFGLVHLGLAFADGPLAETLTEKTYRTETEALAFLTRICEEQEIEALVFGLPEGKLALTIKSFVQKLTNMVHLPVYFQDETLSTLEAKQKMFSAGVPQAKRRHDHVAAAALILQDYLDTINHV